MVKGIDPPREKAPRGFTLIELSIVLVIIGLITGGILVGRDMIKAAEIRSTITQLTLYQAAANTFRVKYNYLPGDIPATQAAKFGFVAGDGTAGRGDGNGFIAGGWGGWGHVIGNGETAVFWEDLSQAGLIGDSFTAAVMAPGGPDLTTPNIGLILPAAKLGGGNSVYVWSMGTVVPSYAETGPNYFGLSVVSLLANSSNVGKMTSTPGLTVEQAQNIDDKLDDGLPLTGKIISIYVSNDPIWSDGTQPFYAPPPTAAVTGSANTCFDNNGGALNHMIYSTAVSSGANIKCGFSLKL